MVTPSPHMAIVSFHAQAVIHRRTARWAYHARELTAEPGRPERAQPRFYSPQPTFPFLSATESWGRIPSMMMAGDITMMRIADTRRQRSAARVGADARK